MSNTGATNKLKVLIYSSNSLTREAVKLALGRKPVPELPQVEFVECATDVAAVKAMDSGTMDLAILDGEATPAGGMGIARQLKDEIYRCAPILVLIGRPQDAWLATWSRADAVVAHPIDPLALSEATATLLRRRVAAGATITA